MIKRDLTEIFEILGKYKGTNPYINVLKREVCDFGNLGILNDFAVRYIEGNYRYKPKEVNRVTTLLDWYATEKKRDWGSDILPTKLKIISIIGETDEYYHCYCQYRQSVPPKLELIKKIGLLKDVTFSDFNDLDVDFDRYDNISTTKDPDRKLREHQKEAVKFLLSRKKCILADSMGLGKTTSMAVAAIEGNFDSILIICPASIKTTWADELKWYVNEKDISIIESFNNKTKKELELFLGYGENKSKKKRDELLEEAKELGKWKNNRFVIINYDILDEFYSKTGRTKKTLEQNLENNKLLKYIYNRKSLIIIDEAHRLSDNSSIRYKIISDLIRKGNPDSVYLSTGTPITNNPENLYCVLKLINSPVTLDWNYYMKRYCDAQKIPAKGEKARLTNIFLKRKKKNSWYDLTFQEKRELDDFISKYARKITLTNGSSNEDELKDVISHIYLRRIKEDLDSSLQKVIHEIRYDLNPEEQAEYEVLWDKYEESKKELDPEKEINKSLLEGAIYRQYISKIMVPKTTKLVDELVEQGEKVVIACCFDDELYTLKDYYGDKCVIYNGKMNSKQKDLSVDKFMNDPDCKVFIGNIMAAGVGITLISSCHLVFNDIDYVPGNNFQMQDRICRLGQKRTCHVYYQIFNNTQYEKIWDIVMKKSFTIDQIIKKEVEK